MDMRGIVIIFILIGLFIHSCTRYEHDIDHIFLCAMDEMIKDHNFKREWLERESYFSWVPDGYIDNQEYFTNDGNVSWTHLETVDVDVDRLASVINARLGHGQKMTVLSQKEIEHKLRYDREELFCSWFFGALRRKGNRYYLKGGFAVSSREGSGATFVIDVRDDGNCAIIEYHPVIF